MNRYAPFTGGVQFGHASQHPAGRHAVGRRLRACRACRAQGDGEVHVEDFDLIEGFYPGRYYVQALWRNLLIETIVMADDPFCSVVRRAA